MKYTVKCTSYNDFLEGCFFIGKKQGYTSNLLISEIAEVENIQKDKYRVIKIKESSKERVKPKCEHFTKCGGCHILHMSDNHQKEAKIEYVKKAFQKNGIKMPNYSFIEAKTKEGYRNKMQVAFKQIKGNLVCGFYEEDSHKIIPLKNCLVQTKRQNEIIQAVQEIVKKLNIKAYDEDKRTGFLRFVMIREGFVSKEVLLTIVTNEEMFLRKNEFVKMLMQKCPYITSIVQNINKRKTSIILGDDEKNLFGKGYINDTLCGINFKISSKTFYQINHEQTEKLYGKVIEYANLSQKETVLDAYSGIGTIGMCLAKDAKKVIGVENNFQSVKNAKANAVSNNIKNISFIHDDATLFMLNYDDEVDVLIMDPPRSGSTKEFLNAIERLKPKKVIYVSCEAMTLANDLKLLKSYEIKDLTMVDLFYGTYHVECVVSLLRK